RVIDPDHTYNMPSAVVCSTAAPAEGSRANSYEGTVFFGINYWLAESDAGRQHLLCNRLAGGSTLNVDLARQVPATMRFPARTDTANPA
ncbi:hypothetical protein U2102_14840, partial [Listeria monocytogenes]